VRIKLDENLPAGLVPLLTALGHDVDTVPAEGIGGQEDDVVWRTAQADGGFLKPQNLDFWDARKYAPGTHHGLLLGRLPQPGRVALQERVADSVSDRSGLHMVRLSRDGDAQKIASQKDRLIPLG